MSLNYRHCILLDEESENYLNELQDNNFNGFSFNLSKIVRKQLKYFYNKMKREQENGKSSIEKYCAKTGLTKEEVYEIANLNWLEEE